MCGIIGYVGPKEATPILIDGLRRLEYRGYDSAGVAIFDGQHLALRRAKGKLSRLESALAESPLHGHLGVGHTRWATHGRPSEENAHPHVVDGVAVVHNGIIENHLQLRADLAASGSIFRSETDTELVAHLIARQMRAGAGLEQAVRHALGEIRGAFALVIVAEGEPDKIIVAKNASPLVIGLGQGENFVASDIPAILNHTREIIFLDEGEMAVISADRVRVTAIASDVEIEKSVTHVTWSPVAAEKGGYKHFMLKEIHEQSGTIADCMRGRMNAEEGWIHLGG
ncbi:MAG: glutamine--fructose-6-phosphate aminotransferase, partial [Myxococcales bacterium]|nr:glutamine--fructose-6-phosphate aminotransferase [Myxococcales bacterium]